MSLPNKVTTDQLSRLIYELRGQRVMLDSDLVPIYGVETKALNRAKLHPVAKCDQIETGPRDWGQKAY